ncbi:13015_t:CDS:1, partial [Gigaspora rosea]
KLSSNLVSFFNNTTFTKKFSPIETEIKIYFDLSQITLYNFDNPEYKTENPLSWWQLHIKTLPLLACLACQYLAIPTILVLFEHLFLIAGNILTDKRHRLFPKNVYDLVFLKENSKNFNIYPGLE